jgi:hypothetical protein
VEVRASAEQVLREAMKDQHPNETFEKALSRAVRKNQGTFRDYMDLIARVRARAKRDGGDLVSGADAILRESA